MQWDGGGGQLRDLVEVIVGQYGCADVLMVVTMLPLVVVKVAGVGVQVTGEVVKRAVVLEDRASMLEVLCVSTKASGLTRWVKVFLDCKIVT